MLIVIGMLNRPTQENQIILDECGITPEIQKAILDKIKVYYIITPLTHFDTGMEQQMKKFFIPSFLSNSMKKVILPSLTQYKYNQKSPIDYLPQWKEINNASIILHLENKDKSVSNLHNIENFKLLVDVFDHNNIHISMTDNGGHKQYDTFIKQIIHGHNQMQGCSYFKDKEDLARTQKR